MSTRSVSKQWVIEAATAYLDCRDEQIQRERSLLIDYYRGPYRSWFRWRHRVLTVAIQQALQDDEWDLIRVRGDHWARRAEQLKSLALVPGNEPVILSREDADFLLPWGDELVD
jgi:hypothetical protein